MPLVNDDSEVAMPKLHSLACESNPATTVATWWHMTLVLHATCFEFVDSCEMIPVE